jgi:hypothetical protein
MKCKNGLHDLEPADTWRSSNGARCRECYLARNARYDRSEKGRAKRQAWYYSHDWYWHAQKLLRDRVRRRGQADARDQAKIEELLEAHPDLRALLAEAA